MVVLRSSSDTRSLVPAPEQIHQPAALNDSTPPHGEAVQSNRDFVLLARALDLVSGTFVAIDGAFFHGDAGKASIATSKKLREQIAALERDIEAYRAALDSNDAAEAAAPGGRRSRRGWHGYRAEGCGAH